jgi:uncharacterized protein (TIGR03083 family)
VLLTPRYSSPPVISVEVHSSDHPVVRQRQRLAATLRELTDDEWQHPSRCAGWSVQDVVTHLISTNGFWALSIQAGLSGAPTEFLGAFDPVASPAQLVDDVKGTPVEETLEQFASSTADLTAVIDGLSIANWDALGEAPPGHVPIRLVADHALWDCWVHERDILLPLGRPTVVADDEVLTGLRYSAALGRAFEVCAGTPPGGAVALDVRDPDAHVVVEVADDVVRVHDGAAPDGSLSASGDAVEILEMLSMREVTGPVPPAVNSLTAGIAVVFDQVDLPAAQLESSSSRSNTGSVASSQ